MRIYLVVNDLNGKMYVGQTIHSLRSRWKQHCGLSRCTAIHNAIQKHGEENFTVIELFNVNSLSELNLLEESLIRDLNTLSPNGYNLRKGGDNKQHSDISRERMSLAQKGTYHQRWGNGKYPNSGKKFSMESRRKMSLAHAGIKQPKELVEKRRNSLFKPVVCLNTGEVFRSINDAAAYFNVCHQMISRLARTGRPNRNGLLIQFIGKLSCVS